MLSPRSLAETDCPSGCLSGSAMRYSWLKSEACSLDCLLNLKSLIAMEHSRFKTEGSQFFLCTITASFMIQLCWGGRRLKVQNHEQTLCK